jgi:hypothetical protein
MMIVWVWSGRWPGRLSGGLVRLIMMLQWLVGESTLLTVGGILLLSVLSEKGGEIGLLRKHLLMRRSQRGLISHQIPWLLR